MAEERKKASFTKTEVSEIKQDKVSQSVKINIEPQKVHIDIYLKSIGCPVWEQGGKKAFALHHKKEFATVANFAELFKKY